MSIDLESKMPVFVEIVAVVVVFDSFAVSNEENHRIDKILLALNCIHRLALSFSGQIKLSR